MLLVPGFLFSVSEFSLNCEYFSLLDPVCHPRKEGFSIRGLKEQHPMSSSFLHILGVFHKVSWLKSARVSKQFLCKLPMLRR